MGMELVPSFNRMKVLPKHKQAQPLEPDTLQGVYVVVAPDDQDWILQKFEQWFAERDDVSILDYGISDKRGIGYIMLEWQEYEVDPLFISILKHEEVVGDFTVYTIDQEG
jgi:hypothetical protein